MGKNTTIFEEALTSKKKLLFKSVPPERTYPVKCPSCLNPFGISAEFADKYQQINFKYTCPYCGIQRRLED